MRWKRHLPQGEVKAIDFFLRGGDSPVRDLVCQLLDRIEMNESTKTHHTYPATLAACEARVEAYRYTIMTAIRIQETYDEDHR